MIRRAIERLRPEVRPHLPRAYLPCLARQEYVAGWRWGVVCGATAGVLLTLAVLMPLRPAQSPYRPVFERGTGLLVGWCGGPPPGSIEQYRPDVDVTWYPRCPS
jgi:hypothetical protein